MKSTSTQTEKNCTNDTKLCEYAASKFRVYDTRQGWIKTKWSLGI